MRLSLHVVCNSAVQPCIPILLHHITPRCMCVQVNSDRMLVNNFAMHIRVESQEASYVTSEMDMKCFAYPARYASGG
jgi:hypothetical protein